jgi:hypothetical protein
MSQQLASGGIAAASILRPSIDNLFRLDTDTGFALQLEAGRQRIAVEEMTATTDWHNDYARFVLDLAHFLRGMKDSESRRALLANLMRHIISKNHPNAKK